MRRKSLAIYTQIAEQIKDEIMSGRYAAHTPIPSAKQLARQYGVNRMTAMRSVGVLRDEQIVYKRRGLGMFVSEDARETVVAGRRQRFLQSTVSATIAEAKKLQIGKSDLIHLIAAADDYT